MTTPHSIGIIGATGQLGSAIARGLLRNPLPMPDRLWISSRSGKMSSIEDMSEVRFTTRNQALVDACHIVIVSVPPHLASTVDIDAKDEPGGRYRTCLFSVVCEQQCDRGRSR